VFRVVTDADEVLVSTDGQPLGKRGLETRKRILEVIAKLIEQHGLRGLKLADVAQEVGFSAPAFYQYFRDMDEAILALCQEVGEQLPPFTFPAGGWTDGDASSEGTRAFVASFMDYWDEHRAVLWARNVAVNEGDIRFTEIRNKAFMPMGEALLSRIETGQKAGLVDQSFEPRSLSAALIVMLDRVGMLSPERIQSQGGREPEDLITAVAYIFDRALGVVDPGRSA
jgi:AcrR family transcriptional regulator